MGMSSLFRSLLILTILFSRLRIVLGDDGTSDTPTQTATLVGGTSSTSASGSQSQVTSTTGDFTVQYISSTTSTPAISSTPTLSIFSTASNFAVYTITQSSTSPTPTPSPITLATKRSLSPGAKAGITITLLLLLLTILAIIFYLQRRRLQRGNRQPFFSSTHPSTHPSHTTPQAHFEDGIIPTDRPSSAFASRASSVSVKSTRKELEEHYLSSPSASSRHDRHISSSSYGKEKYVPSPVKSLHDVERSKHDQPLDPTADVELSPVKAFKLLGLPPSVAKMPVMSKGAVPPIDEEEEQDVKKKFPRLSSLVELEGCAGAVSVELEGSAVKANPIELPDFEKWERDNEKLRKKKEKRLRRGISWLSLS